MKQPAIVFLSARLALVAALCASGIASAAPVYITSGNVTYNVPTNSDNLFIGKDAQGRLSDPVTGLPYNATVNVVGNAQIFGGMAHNNSTLNVQGGYLYYAGGEGNATVNVSGAAFVNAYVQENAILNMSGGSAAEYVLGDNNAVVNYSGGTALDMTGLGSARLNISGGTIGFGVGLYTAATTANFVGTNLAQAYIGYGSVQHYNSGAVYADRFRVSGTFSGTPRSYDLYIVNSRGASGTANAAPRQISFNGAPLVVAVPEAGTASLMAGAFGMIGALAIARRRKA